MKKLVIAICNRLQNKFDAFIVIEGNRGLGKTCIKGSKVLMSDGKWKNIEDIKIGEEVISPQQDGSFSYEKVLGLHNRFEKDIYEIREVTRRKKLLYTCAGNHEIPILRISHPRVRDKNGKCTEKRLSKQILDIWDAKKISNSYTSGSHICSFSTPLIEYKNVIDPEIEPYSLGVWLGDGHFTDCLGITSMDKEILNEVSKHYPIMSVANKNGTPAKMYRFSKLGKFAKQLVDLRLKNKKSGTKFIPKSCLISSKGYRLKLLAGLIDTDGYIMKKKDNHINITIKSKKLAGDIKDLVFSLGGYSDIKEVHKTCQNNFKGKYCSINISFLNPKIIPLICKRKRLRLGNEMKHDPTHIAIKSIKTKPQEVYGFSLTGNSKWYVTDNWMVTHNSTLAFKLMKLVKQEMKHRGVEGYKFNPKRDLLYERMEVIRFFNDKMRSAIADEMVNVSFSRDFYNEDQKDLIKIINMNRDRCNFCIACIPHFKNLDTQIKRLSSMRITVIRRGLAIVQTPNKTIYSADVWDETVNEKIERDWLKKGITKPKYSKLTTFRGFLKFPKLSDKQEKIYQKIKDDKRNKIAIDKGQIEKEESDPLTIIYNTLTTNKLKNTAMLEGMMLANGFDVKNTKAKLYKKLRENNKPTRLRDYYFGKEEDMRTNLKDLTSNIK